MQKIVNLDNVADARNYILDFVEMYRARTGATIAFVDTTERRIFLTGLSNKDAVFVAHELVRLEAARNKGRMQ